MQGKFSDTPYFMINDFLNEIRNTHHRYQKEIDYKWDVVFVSTFNTPVSTGYSTGHFDFDDDTGNDIVFTDFGDNTYNIMYHYNPNEERQENSYIVSPFINIIAHGDGILDLFVREPNEGYIPIKVKHESTVGDRFNFSSRDTGTTIVPGDTITATLSGASYRFDEYNTSNRDSFLNDFNNNRETYWRNDSVFHNWLRKYAKSYYKDKWGLELDIRKYVNYDKNFLFFHKIFKSRNEIDCRIIFYGMKNFIMDAIPEHQRTPKFKEFMDIFFDELYQEAYNQLKDTWHMVDAMYVALDYLGYLSKFYDMFDVNMFDINELQKREFVRDMIWILKRKGTYTDYFILWRILTNTVNSLNIYERWHTKDVNAWENWPIGINQFDVNTWPNYPYYSDTSGATVVPETEWYDVIYTQKPEYHQPPISGGAGHVYYNKPYPCTVDTYDTSNMILSTHYIIETDVSSEPMDYDKIVSKQTWDNISSYWEYIRPVNRVAHYRIVLAPKTDFSGQFISLYTDVFDKAAYVLTQSVYYYGIITGAYIHTQSQISDEWIIHHNLGGRLHVQVFDVNFNEIIPDDIIFDSNSVLRITFNNDVNGFVLVKKADNDQEQDTISDTWNMISDLDTDKLIINFDEDDVKVYEGDLELLDNIHSTGEFTDNNILSRKNVISEGNVVFFQNTPDTVWNVEHYLGTFGVIANVYDTNNKRIHPSEFILNTTDNMTLEFDKPQAGYVVLIRIGNLNLNNLDFTNIIIQLYENTGDMANGVAPVYTSEIDNTVETPDMYFIQKTIPENETFVFREIAIRHEHGELMFYTKCSETYKPNNVLFALHYRIEKHSQLI